MSELILVSQPCSYIWSPSSGGSPAAAPSGLCEVPLALHPGELQTRLQLFYHTHDRPHKVTLNTAGLVFLTFFDTYFSIHP